MFEEAEVKKNNKTSGQVKKATGQGDRGGDRLKCFKCDSTGHLKKDCPQIPRCGWCGRSYHKESDCYAKARGDPKTEKANKAAGNKKKSGGEKEKSDISKKEKKLKKK